MTDAGDTRSTTAHGTIDYVDLAAARAARGVRMVTSGVVPSPWSEAAKGLFRRIGVSVTAHAPGPRDAAAAEWTRVDNVPAVFYDDEPPRTVSSAILDLAVRLGPPGALVSEDVSARARAFGLVHEIAGDDGLGWHARLLAIDVGLATSGAQGFPPPVAAYLGGKYGHRGAGCAEACRARIHAILDALVVELGDRRFFHGADRPGALDIYAATFLTPLVPFTEADCPGCAPMLRAAFHSSAATLGALPQALVAHRARMFDRGELAYPIRLR